MAREHKDLTQVEVSKRTGINSKSLSHYENDLYSPDIETIRTLANLYEVSTDYLFGIIDKFRHAEPLKSYGKEVQFIIDKYSDSPENVKDAVKALLKVTKEEYSTEIAPEIGAKKENIR
jgi:Predicted transcriptional regulators